MGILKLSHKIFSCFFLVYFTESFLSIRFFDN